MKSSILINYSQTTASWEPLKYKKGLGKSKGSIQTYSLQEYFCSAKLSADLNMAGSKHMKLISLLNLADPF